MYTAPDSALQNASLSSALATIFRGKLCDTLFEDRIPLKFAKGSAIDVAGDDRRSFFFVRRGVVKVGALTDDGREVIYDLRKEATSSENSARAKRPVVTTPLRWKRRK